MEDILTAQLLGGFRLVDGSTPVTGLQPARLQGLFAYLVLHRGRPQSRAHLAALFWPESTDGQARTNLRRLVLDLRRAVPRPERHVHIDHHVLQWLESSPLRLDVEEFQRGVRADASLGDLEQAVVLYRGDLLPECYDDWVIPERERLRQVYFQAVERIVVGLEAQRDYRGAIRYARLLLQHEPMEEATYRHLMRLHALNGDRTGAVRIYHACVTALQRDLGVAPSPATQKAYEQILAVDTLTAHAPTMATPQALPPLVGRADEWARLQQAWHARQSRVVLLRGEAGVGKSRLAEELLTWAGRQGIATVRVGCYAAEAELAYAPVASLLRARPLPQVEPEWRRELARLLPEVSMGDPTGDLPDPITEGWQRQRFFEGTARALLVDQPLLVVIDDLQWCDKESLEWFHFLTRVDPATPMLLLGTVRTEETDASHPLHRVVASWRHTGMIMEIDVPPLDQRETTRLAASIVNAELDEGTAARLFQETEGNPLFTLEIARAGLLGDRGDARLSLPSRVQEVIRARLSTLSTEARELVGVAATIGRAFDFRLLLRIQAKDEGSLIRHLDELWQRRIIREHGADAYDFSHGKLREVAYEELSAAKRRWLHRKVADALEELHAADLDKVSGQIASHFEQAGVQELAIPYYERAAAAAHRIYANEATVAYYQRLLPLTKGAVRITFMRRLANVWQQTGGWALAEEMFRKGLALAEEEGYQEERAECQIGLGFVLRLRGSYAEALRVLADARRAFEELGLKRGISRAVGNMGVVYFELADYTRALSLFELQWEMAHDLSDPAEMRNAMRDMGLVHWAQGDYAQALACHERHLRLAEAHGDHRGVGGMNALNNMGLVYRAQGEYERALGCHQESLNIAREIQNRRGIGVALGNIGIDYEEQGDYLKAFDYLQQQLAIAGELGDRRSESHATWHLGNICEAFGRFRDALDCFAYQLSIAAEIDDRRVAAIALGNVARVFAADGREEEGERLFRASLSLLRELRLPHYICETQYRLADLSLRLLQVAQAEREAAEAFQTAAALKRTPIQFAAELLTVRVELATCQVDPAGTEARLRQLIARYLHPRQQAAAHYELWKLTKTEESRQAAAALYKELFATIPRIEYRRRHHELTGETLPEAPRLPPLPEIITRHQVNLDEALRRVDRLLVPTAS